MNIYKEKTEEVGPMGEERVGSGRSSVRLLVNALNQI